MRYIWLLVVAALSVVACSESDPDPELEKKDGFEFQNARLTVNGKEAKTAEEGETLIMGFEIHPHPQIDSVHFELDGEVVHPIGIKLASDMNKNMLKGSVPLPAGEAGPHTASVVLRGEGGIKKSFSWTTI